MSKFVYSKIPVRTVVGGALMAVGGATVIAFGGSGAMAQASPLGCAGSAAVLGGTVASTPESAGATAALVGGAAALTVDQCGQYIPNPQQQPIGISDPDRALGPGERSGEADDVSGY